MQPMKKPIIYALVHFTKLSFFINLVVTVFITWQVDLYGLARMLPFILWEKTVAWSGILAYFHFFEPERFVFYHNLSLNRAQLFAFAYGVDTVLLLLLLSLFS